MANSNRMSWPIPAEGSDPWYEALLALIRAQDVSGYASRENAQAILSGGGLVTWNAATGLLTWTDDIELLMPISGFVMRVEAGSITIVDGQSVYIDVTRAPSNNVVVAIRQASQVPSSDQALVLAIRVGTRLYWRSGLLLESGDTVNQLGARQGAGNDPNAIHDNLPNEIALIAAKATPLGADLLVIEDTADSNNKKRVTIGSLPATDSNAIHVNVAGEITGIAAKGSPVGADSIVIEDSADSDNKKRVLLSNLPTPSAIPDLRGPAIVVGSTTNGDTALDCDYLDTGNGAQMEAAIQAADDLTHIQDVWIRPGLYNLGAGGGPSGGVTIPAGVKVHGAGRGAVTVQTKSSGDLTAFYLEDGSELEDVTINVTRPTGNGTGGAGAVVLQGNRAECRRVVVEFLDAGSYDATDATELNYAGAFYVDAGDTRIRLIDCGVGLDIPAPQLLTVSSEQLAGFFIDAPITSIAADIERCRVVGTDTAFYVTRTVRIANCEFENPYDKGIYINSSDASESQVTDCWGEMVGDQGTERGVHVRLAVEVDVSNNRLTATTGSAGAVGIYLDGSDNNIVQGNRGSWPSGDGIELNGSSDDNIVLGNHIGSITNSGTGNDVAHNK